MKNAVRARFHAFVMCSECGCKNQATHTRPSWIKKNADMPLCKKHVEFYNAVGLHTKIIQPHNATAHVRAVASNVQQIVGNSELEVTHG